MPRSGAARVPTPLRGFIGCVWHVSYGIGGSARLAIGYAPCAVPRRHWMCVACFPMASSTVDGGDDAHMRLGIAEHQTGCLGENHSLGVAHTLLVETDAIG